VYHFLSFRPHLEYPTFTLSFLLPHPLFSFSVFHCTRLLALSHTLILRLADPHTQILTLTTLPQPPRFRARSHVSPTCTSTCRLPTRPPRPCLAATHRQVRIRHVDNRVDNSSPHVHGRHSSSDNRMVLHSNSSKCPTHLQRHRSRLPTHRPHLHQLHLAHTWRHRTSLMGRTTTLVMIRLPVLPR
jgi:hypothetical protein